MTSSYIIAMFVKSGENVLHACFFSDPLHEVSQSLTPGYNCCFSFSYIAWTINKMEGWPQRRFFRTKNPI